MSLPGGAPPSEKVFGSGWGGRPQRTRWAQLHRSSVQQLPWPAHKRNRQDAKGAKEICGLVKATDALPLIDTDPDPDPYLASP